MTQWLRPSDPSGLAVRALDLTAATPALTEAGPGHPVLTARLRVVYAWGDPAAIRNRDEVFAWVVDVVVALLGHAEVGIFLLTPGSNHLQLVAASGLERFAEDVRCGLGLARGRLAAAALDGRADFGGTTVGPDDHPCEWGMEACVPLRAGGRLLGALAVYGGAARRAGVDESDQAILLAIGRQSGSMLAAFRGEDDAVGCSLVPGP